MSHANSISRLCGAMAPQSWLSLCVYECDQAPQSWWSLYVYECDQAPQSWLSLYVYECDQAPQSWLSLYVYECDQAPQSWWSHWAWPKWCNITKNHCVLYILLFMMKRLIATFDALATPSKTQFSYVYAWTWFLVHIGGVEVDGDQCGYVYVYVNKTVISHVTLSFVWWCWVRNSFQILVSFCCFEDFSSLRTNSFTCSYILYNIPCVSMHGAGLSNLLYSYVSLSVFI